MKDKFWVDYRNLPSSANTLVVSYVGMMTQELTIHPYEKAYVYSDDAGCLPVY